MWWRKLLFVVVLLTALALGWRFLFAMPSTPITPAELTQQYAYQLEKPEPLVFKPTTERRASFSFVGYQGDTVNGYIEWPETPAASHPVLVGVSAMGHSATRWWLAEYKSKPTITQTHQIRAMAVQAGYVVVSIDARFTDSRKDPERDISSIMWDLHVWGDKTDYEKMVHGTVMDLRMLLDRLALQPELDMSRLTVAGYSMGAQIGMLLTGVDARVKQLIAMVPPYLADSTAVVAPKNAAPLIQTASVLLLTANDDEYASTEQNSNLFSAIGSINKRHLHYASGHVLPENYLDDVRPMFALR